MEIVFQLSETDLINVAEFSDPASLQRLIQYIIATFLPDKGRLVSYIEKTSPSCQTCLYDLIKTIKLLPRIPNNYDNLEKAYSVLIRSYKQAITLNENLCQDLEMSKLTEEAWEKRAQLFKQPSRGSYGLTQMNSIELNYEKISLSKKIQELERNFELETEKINQELDEAYDKCRELGKVKEENIRLKENLDRLKDFKKECEDLTKEIECVDSLLEKEISRRKKYKKMIRILENQVTEKEDLLVDKNMKISKLKEELEKRPIEKSETKAFSRIKSRIKTKFSKENVSDSEIPDEDEGVPFGDSLESDIIADQSQTISRLLVGGSLVIGLKEQLEKLQKENIANLDLFKDQKETIKNLRFKSAKYFSLNNILKSTQEIKQQQISKLNESIKGYEQRINEIQEQNDKLNRKIMKLEVESLTMKNNEIEMIKVYELKGDMHRLQMGFLEEKKKLEERIAAKDDENFALKQKILNLEDRCLKSEFSANTYNKKLEDMTGLLSHYEVMFEKQKKYHDKGMDLLDKEIGVKEMEFIKKMRGRGTGDGSTEPPESPSLDDIQHVNKTLRRELKTMKSQMYEIGLDYLNLIELFRKFIRDELIIA